MATAARCKTDYIDTLPGEPSPTCKPYNNVPDLTTGRMIFYSLQDKPINQKCFDNSNNNTVDCTEACSVMVHGKNSRENTLAVPVVKLETHGRAGYYLEVNLYSLQAYKQLRIDPTEKTKFLKNTDLKFPIEKICSVPIKPKMPNIIKAALPPEKSNSLLFMPITIKVKCDPTDPFSTTPDLFGWPPKYVKKIEAGYKRYYPWSQEHCKSGVVWYGKRCANMGEHCDFLRPLSFQNMIHFGGYVPKRVSKTEKYKCGQDEDGKPWIEGHYGVLKNYDKQCYCVKEEEIEKESTIAVYGHDSKTPIPLNVSKKNNHMLTQLPAKLVGLHMIVKRGLQLKVKVSGHAPVIAYMLREAKWEKKDLDFGDWEMISSGPYLGPNSIVNVWQKKKLKAQHDPYDLSTSSAYYMFDDIKSSLTKFNMPFINCNRDITDPNQPCLCNAGYEMTILSPDMCQKVCIPIDKVTPTEPISILIWLIPLLFILSIGIFSAIWWIRYKDTPRGDAVRKYASNAKVSCITCLSICKIKAKTLWENSKESCKNCYKQAYNTNGNNDNSKKKLKRKSLTESLLTTADDDDNDGEIIGIANDKEDTKRKDGILSSIFRSSKSGSYSSLLKSKKTQERNEIELLLETLNMLQYKDSLVEIGCDTLEMAAMATLDDLIVDAKMKKMHAKIFLKAVSGKKVQSDALSQNNDTIGDGNLNIVNSNDEIQETTEVISNENEILEDNVKK
jgi:hypothetical protein